MLWFVKGVKGDSLGVGVLADKAEVSLVSSMRLVRVLIASGDAERVALTRESLHAWPETVVCEVAANAEEAAAQVETERPHIICWDTDFGPAPPTLAREVCLLLLEKESCQLPNEPCSETALPTAYVVGLQRSINREYELRRALFRRQPALNVSAPPPSPRVPEDRLRAIGQLAAGLAHEVNNPLTFVLANLESLRESHQVIRRFVRKLRVELDNEGKLDPNAFEQLTEDANLEEVMDDVADMLTDCNKGMHRIQDIARSLGTFSRASDEQAELIDLARVVDDACAMVFNQIRYRARLVKRFEPIPMVAAYPGRIAQALVNMLTNAVEAIDRGAYEKHRIVVSTRVENDHVIIGISDTGVGIVEADRDRIFTAGFTTKARDGGMGLGLSLCMGVAEKHRGRVEVHRLPDRGTRFELIIPVDTGLQPIERKRESRPISEAPATRARILIVDDDAMVLSALRRRLRRRYETVTILGGVEALARLVEDSNFDAIICDLMMPVVDGKSFYDAIQQEHPQLVERVVFMSGGAFTPRLRKFAASVPNPVLQKPVTREHLESTLASIQEEPSVD